jgi:hypothetical protein
MKPVFRKNVKVCFHFLELFLRGTQLAQTAAIQMVARAASIFAVAARRGMKGSPIRAGVS